MAVALDALLYLGVVLLLGAGIVRRWIAPGLVAEGGSAARLRVGADVGRALVIAASAASLASTLALVAGFLGFASTIAGGYVVGVVPGLALLSRIALVVALVLVDRARLGRRLDGALFALLGAGLLLSVAAVGHAAAGGGMRGGANDFAHLLAMTLWVGPMTFVALLPASLETPVFAAALARAAWLARGAVALLVATGVVNAALVLDRPDALTTTPYGALLTAKLALFAVALLLALVDTLLLAELRRGRRGGQPGRDAVPDETPNQLRSTLRLEVALLLTVLVCTAALGARDPTHRPDAHGHAHGHGGLERPPAADRANRTRGLNEEAEREG